MKCLLPFLLIFVALVFIFVVAPACFGQTAPLMTNVSHRSTISLDGNWNTIVDPYETGMGAKYFSHPRPIEKGEVVEIDFARAPKLHVPGDWNTQRESLLFYEGPVWYQRQFSYKKRANVRAFLYFGAANYLARVWLNGKQAGEHIGGFTPFNFEVTPLLADGENSIVIEVDNTRRDEGVPALRTDWWNYGGLTRSVQLVEVPETFVENYSLQLAKGSADRVEGWVQLNGPAGRGQVTVEIPELHFRQTFPLDQARRAEIKAQLGPELWSPEHPRLYRVTISGEADSISDEIGFRTVETRGSQILLNGQPVFLRGICVHEEAPFRSGRAYSEEDDRTLLTWVKELGGNFVRLAHYPHNEEMIRLADRLGILVWEEVPVYWDVKWENVATLENAKQQLREIVARDRNRASVGLWSMSNETPIIQPRTQFLKTLAAYARELDSSRLITSAFSHTERVAADTRSLSDPLGEALDVIGLNEYIGWYEGRPEDADRAQWQDPLGKPVIVSEFGADALYNLHGDPDTKFTEEYQANVFHHQIAMLSRLPFVAGTSPWLLMDFRSPRRPLAGIQDYFNRKGVISDHGQRKQAFYVLQKFYREKAGPPAAVPGP